MNEAKTPWREWIKTIGVLLNDENPHRILFRNEQYTFEVIESGNNLEVKYDINLPKQNPLFIKLLKSVFRKSALLRWLPRM